jgi:DNA polymerase III epsilon subunit-like protein
MQTSPEFSLRLHSIETARSVLAKNPVFLDTETTGLGNEDEIIELAIVEHDGTVLFNSLVRPTRVIPTEATAIHGITNVEVQNARTWPLVWPEVRGHLFGRLVVIYNQDFDLRMLQQTHARYKLPWKDRLNTFDLLKLYAEYHGEWDPKRRSYRYQSLDSAGKQCGIPLPNSHRAVADTLLTRAVLNYIAEQTG